MQPRIQKQVDLLALPSISVEEEPLENVPETSLSQEELSTSTLEASASPTATLTNLNLLIHEPPARSLLGPRPSTHRSLDRDVALHRVLHAHQLLPGSSLIYTYWRSPALVPIAIALGPIV
ncbi:hypothetical protein ACLOJK_039898 [Asimina triloba]